MDSPNTPNKLIIGVIVAILIVAVAAVVIAENDKKQTAIETDTSSTNKTATDDTSVGGKNNAKTTSGNYKDGTYSASGSYRTPGGRESIDVEVVIADGVVTGATVTQNASSGEAGEYQSRFVSGYESQVVGKKIDEVSLSRVAGSSLTPLGFNTAFDAIKDDAKA